MSCVLEYGTQPPVLKCTICGGTSPLSLPLEISQMTTLINVFQARHSECWKKNAPKWADVEKTLPKGNR